MNVREREVKTYDLEPKPLDDDPSDPCRLFSILFVIFVTAIIVITTAAVFFPLMKPRATVEGVKATVQTTSGGQGAPR